MQFLEAQDKGAMASLTQALIGVIYNNNNDAILRTDTTGPLVKVLYKLCAKNYDLKNKLEKGIAIPKEISRLHKILKAQHEKSNASVAASREADDAAAIAAADPHNAEAATTATTAAATAAAVPIKALAGEILLFLYQLPLEEEAIFLQDEAAKIAKAQKIPTAHAMPFALAKLPKAPPATAVQLALLGDGIAMLSPRKKAVVLEAGELLEEKRDEKEEEYGAAAAAQQQAVPQSPLQEAAAPAPAPLEEVAMANSRAASLSVVRARTVFFEEKGNAAQSNDPTPRTGKQVSARIKAAQVGIRLPIVPGGI